MGDFALFAGYMVTLAALPRWIGRILVRQRQAMVAYGRMGALTEGAGVVTTRGHVHYVATEYGIVDLHGLSLQKRAQALISIAHPDFRAELQREVSQLRHFVF